MVVLSANVVAHAAVPITQGMVFEAIAGGETDKTIAYITENPKLVNEKGASFMRIAAQYGNLNLIKLLVEKGVAVSVDKKNSWDYPIVQAAISGHLDVVKYLVSQGVDVTNVPEMLRWAASSGKENLVRYLVEEKGLDVDEPGPFGESAVHNAAAAASKIDALKYLLSKSTKAINTTNGDGDTPLLVALHSDGNRLPFIELLVKHGADINARVSSKRYGSLFFGGKETLLHHIASFANNTDSMKYLIKQEIDVKAKNNFGNTALHVVAPSWDEETWDKKVSSLLGKVRLLADAGADVNAQNVDGKTPLHMTVNIGESDEDFRDPGIVALLLELGADPTIKDKAGNTPAHYARDPKIKELLK